MAVHSFNDAYQAKHGQAPETQVTKKQLAGMYGRTTRWVELRVAEGMPSSIDSKGRRIFRPSDVAAWLTEHAA